MIARRRPAVVALLAALTLLLVAALLVLTRSAPRRSGTNMTAMQSVTLSLPPGQTLCEPGEIVPADTAGLRVLAQTASPSGSLRASVLGATGTTIAAGSVAAGWRPGNVTIPIGRVRSTIVATVCLRNGGAHPLQFGGSQPDPPFTVLVNGVQQSGRLRIDYMRPGSESWLELAPTLAYRLSLSRSLLTGPWAAVAVLVLMLAVALLTAYVLIGHPERGA